MELGRGISARITADIGYQRTQLFGLVSMFLLATALNINSGVALLPLQVLFLTFTLAVIPVLISTLDQTDPGVMQAPPRDPQASASLTMWFAVMALATAIAGGAHRVATSNVNDFAPPRYVTSGQVAIATPSEFLLTVLDVHPDLMATARRHHHH